MKSNIKFTVQFIIGLFGYALGLILINVFFKEDSNLKYGLVLLPIVPLVYIVAITIGAVTRLDEMWRKILTEAMAFSGLATGFTCFSYIFVRHLGMPTFQPEWAFYMMWFYYGIGAIWFGRKY
jgi:hypothetical protein